MAPGIGRGSRARTHRGGTRRCGWMSLTDLVHPSLPCRRPRALFAGRARSTEPELRSSLIQREVGSEKSGQSLVVLSCLRILSTHFEVNVSATLKLTGTPMEEPVLLLLTRSVLP